MDTAHTIKLTNIVVEAAKKQATDLHLNIGMKPMIRVDGKLSPLDHLDILEKGFVSDTVKFLLNETQEERLEKERGITVTHVFGDKIRSKVNIYYHEGVLAVSVRLLSLKVKSLDELGAPEILKTFATSKEGILLIGGEYGSGRTTLANAILEEINRTEARHIMTIEDPIEFSLGSNKSIVDQREVGADVNTFEDALIYVQREDVDVLFVSELNSEDAIRQTLENAEAGVFTIAIIDADSAVACIEKLISGVSDEEKEHTRKMIARTLKGVVIQRLVPKIGGGVVAVHEVLVGTKAARSFVASDNLDQVDSLIRNAKADGMLSGDEALVELARTEEISPEVARQAATNEDYVVRLIRGTE